MKWALYSHPFSYDNADRLTGNGSLTTTGPAPTLAYDAHGNTTVLGDQNLTYDVLDQHLTTTLTDGTVIAYTRDATGQIVKRVSTKPGAPTQTVKFSSGMTLNSAGAMAQWTVGVREAFKTYTYNVYVWARPSELTPEGTR